jgi:hypothetical protein
MAKKCCKNCHWAKWKTSESGKRNFNQAGECVVPVKLPKVPESWSAPIEDRRVGIWAEYGDECELFLDVSVAADNVEWTRTPPCKPGYYCVRTLRDFRKRIVHVWHYKDDPKKLFTNEDGAAPVNDEIYNDVEWKGPIEIDI